MGGQNLQDPFHVLWWEDLRGCTWLVGGATQACLTDGQDHHSHLMGGQSYNVSRGEQCLAQHCHRPSLMVYGRSQPIRQTYKYTKEGEITALSHLSGLCKQVYLATGHDKIKRIEAKFIRFKRSSPIKVFIRHTKPALVHWGQVRKNCAIISTILVYHILFSRSKHDCMSSFIPQKNT